MKSFLQQLRAMLAKWDATSDHKFSASDWNAFFNEALQQAVPFSRDARERRAIITQIMQHADAHTRTQVADALLFADDLNEAHDAILMCDQRRPEAA
jgi:hypothetical protein